jgi:putative ABC transport system permease protein
MRRLLARFISLFHRSRLDQDLDDEITAHLEFATAENVARGMPPDEARIAAARSFGSVAQTKETYRDLRGLPMLEIIGQDVRYAIRTSRRTPGFTVVAIGTLALAIGANTAIFSIIYSVLIRSLPYRHANRLVTVEGTRKYAGSAQPLPARFSVDEADRLRLALRSVDTLIAFEPTVVQLTTDDGSDVVSSATVSSTFFSTLSGPMASGRALGSSDDVKPVTVISDRLATRLFGDPSRAIGGHVSLNTNIYTVIGVTGSDWTIPTPNTDVWIPLGYKRQSPSSGCCELQLLALLMPGTTVAQGRADFETAAGHLAVDDPRGFRDLRISVVPLRDHQLGNAKSALLVLWAAVGLVLVVACANVLNLLVVRNAARTRETTIRVALGASRSRLILQGLTEASILTAAAVVAGLVLGSVLLRLFLQMNAGTWINAHPVVIDAQVLSFAVAVGALTALATGVVPSLHAGRPVTTAATAASPTRQRRRLQRVLCVGQLAAALILVVAATLFGRSLLGLLRTDLGVASDGLLTASVNLSFGQRHTDADAIRTFTAIIDRVRDLPGVQSTGFGTSLPPDKSRFNALLKRMPDDVGVLASAVNVSPGYLSTLGVRLLKGRLFSDADDDEHPPVLIISASTARRLLGDEDPIGKTLVVPVTRNRTRTDAAMTIVGVVSDVKYSGLDQTARDQVYRPLAQQPWVSGFLAARAESDPAALSAEIRKAIAEVAPTVAVSDIGTLDAMVARAVAPPRFRTVLIGAFAVLGVVIAVVGLYGLVAYAVTQRTTELGVRLAMGAQSSDIFRLVLGDALAIAAAGVAVGVPAAYTASRSFAALLFGIAPGDPVTYIASTIAVLIVAMLASYVPAARATRVDPVIALRVE